jgi:hypothetical protein
MGSDFDFLPAFSAGDFTPAFAAGRPGAAPHAGPSI